MVQEKERGFSVDLPVPVRNFWVGRYSAVQCSLVQVQEVLVKGGIEYLDSSADTAIVDGDMNQTRMYLLSDCRQGPGPNLVSSHSVDGFDPPKVGEGRAPASFGSGVSWDGS